MTNPKADNETLRVIIKQIIRRNPNFLGSVAAMGIGELRQAFVYNQAKEIAEGTATIDDFHRPFALVRECHTDFMADKVAQREDQDARIMISTTKFIEMGRPILDAEWPDKIPLYPCLQGKQMHESQKGFMPCPNIVVRDMKRVKCGAPIDIFYALLSAACIDHGANEPTEESIRAGLIALKTRTIFVRCARCGKVLELRDNEAPVRR